MFTSRSEFRLLLRIDNADYRLSPLGHELGLLPDVAHARFKEKYDALEQMRQVLRERRWKPEDFPELASNTRPDLTTARGATLEQILRRPDVSLNDLAPLLKPLNCWPSSEVRHSVEIEIKYEGYIVQQQRDAEKMRKFGARGIPTDFDYSKIDGLSREIREKLNRIRPFDLATAGRIPGVTPAAISILNIHLELAHNRRKKAP
jgi:tRNA uridine 5-carboxymethylaminomethyl modification enzyme